MCRSSRSAAFTSPVGHLVGSGRRTWRDSDAGRACLVAPALAECPVNTWDEFGGSPEREQCGGQFAASAASRRKAELDSGYLAVAFRGPRTWAFRAIRSGHPRFRL